MERLSQSWLPNRSVPLRDILAPLHRGAGDPCMVLAEHDVWWALRTPTGIAGTWWSVRLRDGQNEVRLEAVGPGAAWLAGRLPRILGDEEDMSSFTPNHPLLMHAWRQRRHRDWRVAKTGLVLTSLIPSILEQKVTGKQAFGAHRFLVRRHGTSVTFSPEALRAAGAQAGRVAALMAPPDNAGWRRIPSWQWLHAGVEPAQSRTVMRACEVASALEGTSALALPEAHRRLRAVPGIGVWTAAKVAQSAWGDSDAPTYEDYHVASQLGHAVLGRSTDDAGMAALLEPYRGHRFRAEHLMLAVAAPKPRHGPRMALPQHLPNRAVR